MSTHYCSLAFNELEELNQRLDHQVEFSSELATFVKSTHTSIPSVLADLSSEITLITGRITVSF